MKTFTRRLVESTALALIGTPCLAQTVSLYEPGTSGISTLSYSVVGSVITVSARWQADTPAFLRFTGLTDSTVYTLRIENTNNSSASWIRMAYELLDPVGNPNDSQDVLPYPTFVPAGYSTSNDDDGLSFAQDRGLPRTSAIFRTVSADELNDRRDFLDFSNGVQSIGATDRYTTFGLRDEGPVSQNQPFLLSIRPAVPELPSPLLLLAGSVVLIRQHRSVFPKSR